jgi:hypothetical protein
MMVVAPSLLVREASDAAIWGPSVVIQIRATPKMAKTAAQVEPTMMMRMRVTAQSTPELGERSMSVLGLGVTTLLALAVIIGGVVLIALDKGVEGLILLPAALATFLARFVWLFLGRGEPPSQS